MTDTLSIDRADYCRQIETYLCRKNAGHLVRIVGPAFEQVCAWADRGVPLKVAFRGIDRYCERYYADGRKRRPVRIEFCEADVLEAFDDWRRAVGVTGPAAGASTAAEDRPDDALRRPPLAAHIERVITRLTALQSGGSRSARFDEVLAGAVRELASLHSAARLARGEHRAEIIRRLADIDNALLTAARDELDADAAGQLSREAEAELAPFRARIPPDARARAVDAALGRLVRDAVGLPILSYE